MLNLGPLMEMVPDLSIHIYIYFFLSGMEAIWKVEVEDFPAFIVVDDKGNDFFAKWQAD